MNAPANNSTKPVAPTSRIGYVFKDKSEKEFADPLKAYEGLALTQCGHFPLGANGSFHGGIHFTAGSKATFSQDKGVRCIANGEVVAYRIDRRYPDATPADSGEPAPKDGKALRPYSTGFVLVRHRMQPPVPALPAPPKESAITIFGTDLCNTAGRPLAWLPQGATLRLNGRTNQNGTWAQVDELTTPDQAVWSVAPQPDVWVRVSDLMPTGPTRSVLARLIEPSEYRINPAADRPDPRQVQANCDARLQQDEHRKQCAAAANPPTLTWYSLYMQLGDLASYEAQPKRSRPPWWSGEKPETRLPHKLDAVMVLDTPLSIRQGQVVGFLGEDVPSDAWLPASRPASRELLHLEAFSGEDVPGFMGDCRAWAQQLPEDKRTQLGLKSGDELRGQPASDAPVVATVSNGQTFPLDALKQAKDAEGRIWRQVSVRTTGTATVIGWIEESGRRVSPWAWRDFQVIEEASNPAGTWWDDVQQFADYLRGSGVRPKETPLFAKIRSWLDSNGDGQLDERELDMALKDRQLSSLVGGLIVRHRSAWDVPDWKERFGAIDELIENLGNHEDSVRYRASEMNRVRKLDWWSYVAAKLPEFPTDSNVYHFHPVALAASFEGLAEESAPWMEIAVSQLKQWGGTKETVIDDTINYHREIGLPYNTLSTAWCASFVNYCLKEAGYEHSGSAGSQSFKSSPHFQKISSPVYGALVVYSNPSKPGQGHVAFAYCNLKGGDLAVLGGNQGDTISLNTHLGVYVNALKYKLEGYYVPVRYKDYAEAQLSSGGDLGDAMHTLASLRASFGKSSSGSAADQNTR